MSDAVRYELRGPVAWVTIDRPESRNALSREVREGLWAGYRRFAADAEAAVMVVTGAGDRAFCAGADLKEMAGESLRVPPEDYFPVLGRNIEIDKPVIAAVNGAAYAGGFLLAQSADLCIAAAHARFAISEARVGRGSPWAAPLPWLIPPRVALQLMLTGDPIDAARAHVIGLVNEVVEFAALAAAAQALAERIAANAPLSVRAAKRMVYASAGRPLAEALDAAHAAYREVYLSEDAQEGPRAFREKREPRWAGR